MFFCCFFHIVLVSFIICLSAESRSLVQALKSTASGGAYLKVYFKKEEYSYDVFSETEEESS